MTRFAPDLDGHDGASRKMLGVQVAARTNEPIERRIIDRVWNPCEPSEPHIQVIAEGVSVGVALVGLFSPPVFIDPAASPLETARAIYAFAQDFKAYEAQETDSSRVEELEARVTELEGEVERADDEAMGLRDALGELLEKVVTIEEKFAAVDPKLPALVELRQIRESAEKRINT